MDKQVDASHRAKNKDKTAEKISRADKMFGQPSFAMIRSWMYCMALDKNPFKSRRLDPHSRHEQYKVSNHVEKQIDSCHTNYEKQSWADLPQDVLLSIFRILHFPDQIRSLNVCKNWRLMSQEYGMAMRCTDHLPWVMNVSWIYSMVRDKNPFECRLFDPHSQQLYKVSNRVGKFEINTFRSPDVYASKQGWLLLGGSSSLFVFNPFSNEVIELPSLRYYNNNINVQATLKVNNSSSGEYCEVFVICRIGKNDDDPLYICSYDCSSREKEWRKKLVDTTEEECLSVHYMDGKLYCAFEEGMLKRYTVTDQAWDLLTLGSYDLDWDIDIDLCWLNENKGGDLIMVSCEWDYEYGVWHIFRFDWSDMKWILENSLDRVAFFISGRILLKTPLVDNGEKIIDDCKVFFHGVGEYDEDDGDESNVMCYSFRKGRLVDTQEFGWSKWCYGTSISFIEPPYFGTK